MIALAGIALAATAWAALTPIDVDSSEQVYVIPKGTWARRMAGEKLEVLPSEIHLTIGVKDVLVLRNQDDVPQLFGPVLIMPGQSFRASFPFGVEVSVSLHAARERTARRRRRADAEPGWARLRWRAAAPCERREDGPERDSLWAG